MTERDYCKYYFLRHAESLSNVSGDVTILDPELSEDGRRQCTEISFPPLAEDALIVSSTARRTLQTATLFFPDRSIYATDLFLEYNTGVPCNQRRSLSVQKEEFPMVDFTTYEVSELPIERTWQDGIDRAKRIRTFLESLHRSEVVVVTHANILRNIIQELTGMYEEKEIPNARWIAMNVTLKRLPEE